MRDNFQLALNTGTLKAWPNKVQIAISRLKKVCGALYYEWISGRVNHNEPSLVKDQGLLAGIVKLETRSASVWQFGSRTVFLFNWSRWWCEDCDMRIRCLAVHIPAISAAVRDRMTYRLNCRGVGKMLRTRAVFLRMCCTGCYLKMIYGGRIWDFVGHYDLAAWKLRKQGVLSDQQQD